MTTRTRLLTVTAALAALPGLALAHTGAGAHGGFAAGVLHPLTGADHLLALFAVGLWSSQQTGRVRWLLPAAFVTVMAMAALAGITGLAPGFTEAGILLSVVTLGALAALALRTRTAAGLAVVGAFAVFHGLAHGAEMPAAGSLAGYFAGFALATALVHTVGLGLGLATRGGRFPSTGRLIGGAIAAAGVLLALM